MTASHVVAFAAAALVLILAPGPSVLFVVGRALTYGRSVAVASAVGGTLGSLLLATLVAVGLGAVIASSAAFFLALKIIGGLYLCYLGVQAIRGRRELTIGPAREGSGSAHWTAARQGVVVGVTNPKTLVFFGAVLPQFVVSQSGLSPTVQMLVFAVIFCVIAALCDSMWGVAASGARNWFARSPRRLSLIGGAGGVTMIGLGAALVVAGRPS